MPFGMEHRGSVAVFRSTHDPLEVKETAVFQTLLNRLASLRQLPLGKRMSEFFS